MGTPAQGGWWQRSLAQQGEGGGRSQREARWRRRQRCSRSWAPACCRCRPRSRMSTSENETKDHEWVVDFYLCSRFLAGAVPTHQVATVGDLGTSSEQAVVQGDAAFGHRHTFPTCVHHMEGVTIFCVCRKQEQEHYIPLRKSGKNECLIVIFIFIHVFAFSETSSGVESFAVFCFVFGQ